MTDAADVASVAAGLPRRKFRISFVLLSPLVIAFEAALIVVLAALSGPAYVYGFDGPSSDIDLTVAIGIITALIFILVSHTRGLYDTAPLLGASRALSKVATTWLFAFMAVTLLLFLLKLGDKPSRGAMTIFFFTGFAALLVDRRILINLLSQAFRAGIVGGRRTVLIGTQDQISALNEDSLLRHFGVEVIARFLLEQPSGSLALSKSELGSVSRAIEVARAARADEVALAVSWHDERRLQLLREELRVLPIVVRLLPDRAVGSLLQSGAFGRRRANSIELQRSPLSSMERLQKYIFDTVGASIGLLLFSPLLLMAALAVKLESPGPVLFRQKRKGFNGQMFTILKFRSMRVQEDGPVIRQAQMNDDRVTRVGRILRRTSIDELPQLLNVLQGDMSLIGPRPHAVAHDDYYSSLIAHYAFRQHVKPGITGWAQINNCRGETADVEQMRRRVEHDLCYIANWSIMLDLRIAFTTCFALLKKNGAY
jgi:undecaprenyl-phosphate galactose phosphotransferase/putative colanic acid biosynthesis UDP-glucose lipid carrier transferase